MSPEDLDALDRQRRRWRRARTPLRLVDPDADGFSTGGLAARVHEPTVRLLLLPADPDAWLVDFDSEFWAWWRQDRDDPTTGQPASWGYDNLPTEFAALRTAIVENGRFAKYLALHRNGALEFELGENGAYVYPRVNLRVFRLITIVGRVQGVLRLWTEIRSRLQLDGPCELSLALRDTQAAALGNVAEGWQEPGPDMPGRRCPAKHLLCRRELWDWPDEARQLDLVFSIGGWIEDSWGYQERRFLAHPALQSASSTSPRTDRWRC
jgi:hypothetical protein